MVKGKILLSAQGTFHDKIFVNSTVSSANCRYVAGNYYSQFGIKSVIVYITTGYGSCICVALWVLSCNELNKSMKRWLLKSCVVPLSVVVTRPYRQIAIICEKIVPMYYAELFPILGLIFAYTVYHYRHKNFLHSPKLAMAHWGLHL